MLFFRSEERVNEWCAAKRLPRRPLVSLSQLWHLAQAWYADRLSPAARRPGPEEMRAIFARVGLEGPFWDPQADHFGCYTRPAEAQLPFTDLCSPAHHPDLS